jgi:hypothetical protein
MLKTNNATQLNNTCFFDFYFFWFPNARVDDRNLVIYDSQSQPIWMSNTGVANRAAAQQPDPVDEPEQVCIRFETAPN